MSLLDMTILALYFVVVLGVGFHYRRRASRDLESYFLGGKRLHWLPLAMSGSVSNFDITGTMWIVSILFMLGMKSMWHHWMWGFLMGAFFMSYMGKWVRRSNVMTAAEWMKTRFGDGGGGRLARTAYAFMAVLTQASFIGYAYQGIGKFLAVYVPLEAFADRLGVPWIQTLCQQHGPDVLAAAVIGATTLYVILGGLYSVVVTDVVQTVVLTLGSLFIAGAAWCQMTPERLSALPEGFTSLAVPWRIPGFAGRAAHAEFEFFGALVIVWVLKGLLLNAGGPGQMYDFQRFLAARNARDAAKVGAAWSAFLVVRWAMAMGIALLALTGAVGVSDSEKVMPVVLREFLPAGIRGLVIAGLLAAFMSTFSSTVNSGAAFIVRDLWQPLVKARVSERSLVRGGYAATLLIVAAGIAIGSMGESIAQIWGWIMLALGGGVIVPNVLRWYWWRMNGWGYGLGMLGGMALAFWVLFIPELPVYCTFPMIVAVSCAGSVLGSLLTRPVPLEVLTGFYRTVRPFGLWGRVRRASGLYGAERADSSERPSLVLLNVALGMAAITGCYLFPMYAVGRFYGPMAIWICVALAAVTALRFTWYRNLEDK